MTETGAPSPDIASTSPSVDVAVDAAFQRLRGSDSAASDVIPPFLPFGQIDVDATNGKTKFAYEIVPNQRSIRLSLRIQHPKDPGVESHFTVNAASATSIAKSNEVELPANFDPDALAVTVDARTKSSKGERVSPEFTLGSLLGKTWTAMDERGMSPKYVIEQLNDKPGLNTVFEDYQAGLERAKLENPDMVPDQLRVKAAASTRSAASYGSANFLPVHVVEGKDEYGIRRVTVFYEKKNVSVPGDDPTKPQ